MTFYFFIFTTFFLHLNALIETQSFIFQESETMHSVVPEYPLNKGALQIKPIDSLKKYQDWQPQNHIEAYRHMQNIAHVWQRMGITDYMVYAREDQKVSTGFHWEIVPFPKTNSLKNRMYQQIQVLWSLSYGPFRLSDNQRMQSAETIRRHLNLLEVADEEQKLEIGTDIFCDPTIVQLQRVYEGKTVQLLYDYSPLNKYHFLVVPKKHRERFADLTEEEYLEAAELTQKLMHFYYTKGYEITNLFVKTGKDAGQSQPHWHQHIVFSLNNREELAGLLKTLKNLFFGHAPLEKDVLKERIKMIKEELEFCQ